MAESDDPTMEIRVVGDFTEFDQGLQARQRISPTATFGNEGQRGFFSYMAQGSIGAGPQSLGDVARLADQRMAAERFAAAVDRFVSAINAIAGGRGQLGLPPGAVRAGLPGGFQAAGALPGAERGWTGGPGGPNWAWGGGVGGFGGGEVLEGEYTIRGPQRALPGRQAYAGPTASSVHPAFRVRPSPVAYAMAGDEGIESIAAAGLADEGAIDFSGMPPGYGPGRGGRGGMPPQGPGEIPLASPGGYGGYPLAAVGGGPAGGSPPPVIPTPRLYADGGSQAAFAGAAGVMSGYGAAYARRTRYNTLARVMARRGLAQGRGAWRAMDRAVGKIPFGLYFQAMFGGYELATATRAIGQARADAMMAEDDPTALTAQMTGIEGAGGGIFGGISSLLLDALPGVYSPSAARADIPMAVAIAQGAMRTRQSIFSLTRAQRDVAVIGAGGTEQARRAAVREREAVEEGAVLSRDALSGRRTRLQEGMRELMEEEGSGNLLTLGWRRLNWEEYRRRRRNIESALATVNMEEDLLERGVGVAKEKEVETNRLITRDLNFQISDILVSAGAMREIRWATPAASIMQFSRAATVPNLVAMQAAQRRGLIATGQEELRQVSIRDPSLLAAKTAEWDEKLRSFDWSAAQAEGMERLNVQRQRAMISVQQRGAEQVARLTTAFRPTEATVAGMQAQIQAAAIGADPEDAAEIVRIGQLQIAAFRAQVARQQNLRVQAMGAQIGATDLLLSRQPLAAQLMGIRAGFHQQIEQTPEDTPQGRQMRTMLVTQMHQSERLAMQQFFDRRYLDTMQMERQEEVSGLLASAFGPNREQNLWRARVRNIAGQAEERAQARLLADATDVENAQRERRIGVNQLRGARTEYIEGFQARQGDLRRTAFGVAGASADPEKVLMEINQGIKQLVASIKGALTAQP